MYVYFVTYHHARSRVVIGRFGRGGKLRDRNRGENTKAGRLFNIQNKCKIGAERTVMDENKTYARAVIVYVVNPFTGEVFLARNRKGPCKGMLNGFGGEIEMSERAVEAARRELEEETGICVPLEFFEPRGKIEFVNIKKSWWRQRVDCHIFVTTLITGFRIVRLNDKELYDDGKYCIDNLPIREMTRGDQLWVHHVLKGRKIRYGRIERDFDDGSIISHCIDLEWR